MHNSMFLLNLPPVKNINKQKKKKDEYLRNCFHNESRFI